MNRAYLAIKSEPVYRREAFVAGLKACGYDVKIGPPETFDADTLFVCWNRYHENHASCARVEEAGGSVLVAENGYIAPQGGSPHGMNPRTWFALAPSFHNDETVIRGGDSSRLHGLGLDFKPWRADGGHVLVCPNRSFGTPGRIMPGNWTEDVVARLKKLTKREIRVRPHPGNNAPTKPLAEDLAGASACVIWGSSAGVHALVAGVPVICEAPFWICKSAAIPGLEQPEMMPERWPVFQRLAWAQWNLREIESGEAFAHLLLRRATEGEVCATH